MAHTALPLPSPRRRGRRAGPLLACDGVSLLRPGRLARRCSLSRTAHGLHRIGRDLAQSPRIHGRALIAAPIAAILAGVLDFLILDGVTEFPLLALALAPFMIGAAVLTTLPNQVLAGTWPAEPDLHPVRRRVEQSADLQSGTLPGQFVVRLPRPCPAVGGATLIPPVSDERRRQ